MNRSQMEENQNNTDFLKETIKQRPLNKRKLVRRTLITAAMAVIFGMVACFTFLLLEPVISNRLYPEEEPEAIVFEEETEENEILPEDINGALRDMKENGLPMNKKTFAYVLTATILGRDNAVRYVIEQDRKRGLIA